MTTSVVGWWLSGPGVSCSRSAGNCLTEPHYSPTTTSAHPPCAGAEVTNAASIGALTSAGYLLTTRPTSHQLPNGRTVTARWFHHDTEHPSRCR